MVSDGSPCRGRPVLVLLREHYPYHRDRRTAADYFLTYLTFFAMQRGTKFALACVSISILVVGALSMKQMPPPLVISTSTTPVAQTYAQTRNALPLDSKVIAQARQVVPANSIRTPSSASQSAETASKLPSPKSRSDLHVSGILGASNPSQSIAIITVAGRPPTLVRVGDELFDWRVVEIESDKVQLSRNKESISISVEATAKQIPSMDSPAPPLKTSFHEGPRVTGVPGLD